MAGDRPAKRPISLHGEMDQPAGPMAHRELGERIGLFASSPRSRQPPGRGRLRRRQGIGEDVKVRPGQRLADVDQHSIEPDIGLVGAVPGERLVIGQPWNGVAASGRSGTTSRLTAVTISSMVAITSSSTT